MTATTTSPTNAVQETQATPRSIREVARDIGPAIARNAARHDREGTFVADSYAILRAAGFFSAGVPVEFGGAGAGLRDLALAHHDLALFDGSTSLASAMHSHTVATLAWRHRRGAPVEATLRRVVQEGLILVSTGGSDTVRPSAVARRVEGGYSVSGRKVFVSQSPVGSVLVTAAVTEEATPEILSIAIPMSAPGVEVLDNWDAHGMRGTGSNDVRLTDVFIAEGQVGGRRPFGRLDPAIRIALINGLTIITGVYLGLAQAARVAALELVGGGERASDPMLQRLLGQVESDYAAARLAFEGALANLGDDPESSFDNFTTVLHAKRAVAEHGARAIESALAAVGGRAFSRASDLERIARDFRGIFLHPLTPEATLFYAGRVALGGDPEEV